MDVQTTLAPVGKVAAVPGLDTLIAQMKKVWVDTKVTLGKAITNVHVVQFMTNVLDGLIVYLIEHDIPGQDKKATVMNYMSTMYDYVVSASLPLMLRPFAGMIKNFVINVLVSHAIDWVVSKYKDGNWNAATVNAMFTQQQVMKLWGVPGDHRPS